VKEKPTMHQQVALTLLATATLVSGCAPDAWSNVKATGFNAYLNQIAVECAPLYAGPQVITVNYEPPNYATDDYDQWIDQTSRVYYRKISPQTYLTNVDNLLGARSLNSAKCAVSKLPADTEAPPSRLQ
jgi:hypothetical protein